MRGRIGMLIVLPFSRNSTTGAVTGLVALLPAIAFLVHGFTAGAWTSPFCLGG